MFNWLNVGREWRSTLIILPAGECQQKCRRNSSQRAVLQSMRASRVNNVRYGTYFCYIIHSMHSSNNNKVPRLISLDVYGACGWLVMEEVDQKQQKKTIREMQIHACRRQEMWNWEMEAKLCLNWVCRKIVSSLVIKIRAVARVGVLRLLFDWEFNFLDR